MRRLPLGFFSRGEDGLEHRIGVEHGLQEVTMEKTSQDFVVFSGYLVKPSFSLNEHGVTSAQLTCPSTRCNRYISQNFI